MPGLFIEKTQSRFTSILAQEKSIPRARGASKDSVHICRSSSGGSSRKRGKRWCFKLTELSTFQHQGCKDMLEDFVSASSDNIHAEPPKSVSILAPCWTLYDQCLTTFAKSLKMRPLTLHGQGLKVCFRGNIFGSQKI